MRSEDEEDLRVAQASARVGVGIEEVDCRVIIILLHVDGSAVVRENLREERMRCGVRSVWLFVNSLRT